MKACFTKKDGEDVWFDVEDVLRQEASQTPDGRRIPESVGPPLQFKYVSPMSMVYNLELMGIQEKKAFYRIKD